ncbi:hypothetical protein Q5424_09460 [Conexibacter sp. JD483]|uniref:hypothetical protein n=1 Tax=unclassified Conexibacter TaxID=2627773 RepID=UPI002723C69D|nr:MULTISPECIES: hypothetical protein [unclassified Conexibacter]MDO8187196.1 hypothetical protein [Conexibacter sp. CPCC 205706]MDO8199293.1 hypothetical protein [Conexibacter sp. CPCC 205762]MDR9369306.1 hypothetical protein [Conexibacter sp. JD483]
MLPIRNNRALVAAAATALLLAAAPSAMAARGSLSGSINPNKGPIGSPINLKIGAKLDADSSDKERGTLTKIELFFPPNARTNGAKFPSCSPDQINATRSFSSCPKGSKIGGGTLRADVPAVPVFNVPGDITIFNGKGGKSVTINIEAHNPVEIFEAFPATLVKTKGRYGYHLTGNIPSSLQEINDGWFAEVSRFDTSISAKWRGTPYIESTTLCPKSLKVPIGGRFSFLRDNAPLSVTSTIACRR